MAFDRIASYYRYLCDMHNIDNAKSIVCIINQITDDVLATDVLWQKVVEH